MRKLLYILILIPLLISCDSPFINSPYLLKIHYIDIDQGDSTLVQINNINLLIDSGSKENRRDLLNFLDSLNIRKIDYLIASHPHEDHIGNMSSLINKYNIGAFYAPKVTHTSKSFERMIESLIEKKLKINILNSNTTSINLGENVDFSILSPHSKDYGDNLNLYSSIFKITFGSTSFLFTGDAEKSNEEDILSTNNLSSDVIKIAHHGSSTSSSSSFIERVNPKIAIISVGKDNKYNHPSDSTLQTLSENNITIYRTDTHGNITLISDGNIIKKLPSYK